MAISNTIKNKLNKMNRAAQDALLGTIIQNGQNGTGSTVVTTAQMSASAVVIYDVGATLGMYVYQVTRSGSNLNSIGFKAARTGGSLTVMPVNTGSFVVGDVINYQIA